MILSIVSGTYNRMGLLQSMVQSARDCIPVGLTYEFIIVDGGSDDGTIAWCKSQTDIVLIEHGELLGAIRAFCDGAKAAQGRYVILANDDVTFEPGSILPAIVHLETHETCGGVAFADNRPAPYKRADSYSVAYMHARANGRTVSQIYAQVGMFRRWLGDKVGWWGADNPEFTARTYAGDNYLSSMVIGLGYSIDALAPCKVSDLVANDALRQKNMEGFDLGKNEHPDSAAYYKLFPQGALIPPTVQVANPDKQKLRVLYLPIYERHAVQIQQKHGLRDALARSYIVCEMDYLGIPQAGLYEVLQDTINTFQPHLILTQVHGVNHLTVDMVSRLRAHYRAAVWVNWNGDYWPENLTSQPMLGLLRFYDLQLVVNASVLDTYINVGIPAAYWQIGIERPTPPLPDVDSYDVVFLANAYSQARKVFGERLAAWCKAHDVSLGLYGSGWENPAGETLYDFATGEAIYKHAKIAIGDNQFPDAYGFVSNRLFQALGAGGAVLLHQTVPGLEELTGFVDGKHYLAWDDFDSLTTHIQRTLDKPRTGKKIARAGYQFAMDAHSFEARVRELAYDLLPLAKREARLRVPLRFMGTAGGGLKAYNHYIVEPGRVFHVTPEDAELLMVKYPQWIERAQVDNELTEVD